MTGQTHTAGALDDLCQCPRCGRMHRVLGKPPASIAADYSLSHDDLCRLSRGFNMTANVSMSQDERINEWLKAQIARAFETARDKP